MIPVQITIKGLKELERTLGAKIKQEKKALNIAIRKEGGSLRKKLVAEIKAGAPGGRKFKPSREISFGGRKSPPLYTFSRLIRYYATYPAGTIHMRVGFIPHLILEGGWKSKGGYEGMYSTWERMFKEHQQGFRVPASRPQRPLPRYTRGVQYSETFETATFRHGIRLKKKKDPRAKYYFIRPSTRSFKVPARPIIDPFWRTHKREAMRNIRNNYRRKLSGERI